MASSSSSMLGPHDGLTGGSISVTDTGKATRPGAAGSQNSGFALILTCANRPGIVAAVATALSDVGCDIFNAHQFDDALTGRFFMRVLFSAPSPEAVAIFQAAFRDIAREFGMEWRLRDRTKRQRVVIMVSRFDHCLVDLLYRQRIGEIGMEVSAIIANHPRETYAGVDFGSTSFHYLPVTRDAKSVQERRAIEIIDEVGADLVVLARYMQVLSDDMARALNGRCINIHHSFLPSFKGAKPYHQAHMRGVKLIGATAHYVTADLDEGPIIGQDVEHVTHADTPDDLIRLGRDIERRVLARAVASHLDDRIILDGLRTVVFAR